MPPDPAALDQAARLGRAAPHRAASPPQQARAPCIQRERVVRQTSQGSEQAANANNSKQDWKRGKREASAHFRIEGLGFAGEGLADARVHRDVLFAREALRAVAVVERVPVRLQHVLHVNVLPQRLQHAPNRGCQLDATNAEWLTSRMARFSSVYMV